MAGDSSKPRIADRSTAAQHILAEEARDRCAIDKRCHNLGILPRAIGDLGIGTGFQQQLHEGYVASQRCKHHRRVLLLINSVEARTVLDQQACRFEPTGKGSHVQGGPAVVVARIGIGMWLAEERPKGVRLALYDSSVQGIVDGIDWSIRHRALLVCERADCL